MAQEVATIETWVYGKLSNAAGLTALVPADRIYSQIAPDDAVEPLVVFAVTDADDWMVTGAARLTVKAQVNVRAITKGGSALPAHAIAAQIDAALHAVKDTISGKPIAAWRRSQINDAFVENDERYNQSGGVFNVVLGV